MILVTGEAVTSGHCVRLADRGYEVAAIDGADRPWAALDKPR